MSDFDAQYHADVINGNGDPNTSYLNESLRARDVEISTHELEIHGYGLDVWGHPYLK